MLLPIAIAAALSQAVVPAPAEYAGEASLGEIVRFIEARGGVKVHVSEDLAKRPLYFHWVEQPVEDVLKGLAFALDLKLTKADEPAQWSLRSEDRENARIEEAVREIESQMAFRFRLLESSSAEISAMEQAARDRWSESRKTDMSANRESRAISAFENERLLIRIMSMLGKLDYKSHFFGKQSPGNCIILDPLRHPELKIMVPLDTLRPDTRFEGEPIFLIYPLRNPGQHGYELAKVHANTIARITRIVFDLNPVEKGFEPDKSPIFQKSVKLTVPFKILLGHSFEILPPAFKQLDSSFAVWCPMSYQGMSWSRLPDTFPLSFLLERMPIPRRRDSTEPQKYAKSFLQENGWTKVLYTEAPKAELTTDWTKLLPFLRKLRKHEVSVVDLADFVSDLGLRELTALSNALAERADVPLSDFEFLQGLYLIRSISTRKADLETLTPETKQIVIPFTKLSRASREALTNYFATPRFWPLHAWMQHPGFQETLRTTAVALELKEVDGKSVLFISLKGLESTGAYCTIPISHTPKR